MKVAEESVNVSNAARGKGIGKELLQSLIKNSDSNQFWTFQAGIFPKNKASINIHDKSATNW